MSIKGFGFDSYGPFQSKHNELDIADNITLIIGKNNAGKSSAIDFLCQQFGSDLARTRTALPKSVDLHFLLDEQSIENVFSFRVGGGGIPESSHSEFGKQFIGEHFVVRYIYPLTLVVPVSAYNNANLYSAELEERWQDLGSKLLLAFDNYRDTVTIRRLSAERDILPEPDNNAISLSNRGEGASNMIQRIINQNTRDESIIEEKLLGALNDIMEPDAVFESIRVQLVARDGYEAWEVYLKEEGKDRFPLSATGSGLKTIILVLLNLIAVGRQGSGEYIYCFEELENNLHPSLQRRLFEYLYRYSLEEHVKFVLTSHSNVAINTFFDRPGVLIYHAQKACDGTKELKRVLNASEGTNVLEDLGVKASDLFQSNGIIWVEGPSDRVYIKAWLDVLYPGEFVEGLHYQFLYYGGKLLSHYSAEETAEKINVMFINRNSAIVMDSDRRSEKADINATKKRVRKEFNSRGLFYWITAGKEIENYLSVACIEKAIGSRSPKSQIGQFELFNEYIDKAYPKFKDNKVDFARKFADCITVDDLDVLDLPKKIEALRETIAKWNS